MNANELADELETRYKYEEASECMLDAATMLRQQQAEIEALKAKTLTDAEIWEVANYYFVGKNDLVYGFARAILRKAQEK